MSEFVPGEPRECKRASCKAPFKAKRKKHWYCSPKCRTTAWQEKHIRIQIPKTPEALSELGRRVLEGMEGMNKPKGA